LLIVTIVISLAAAALSFLTKKQAEGLLEEKRQAVVDAQKQKSELSKVSAAQKDSEAKIEELSKTKGTLAEEATKAREDLKAREAELAKIKQETADKLAEMGKLQERLKAAEEKMAITVNPPPNAEAEAKLAEMGNQLQRVQQIAAQYEKNSQLLAGQVEDLKKKVDVEKKRAEKAELKRKEGFVFGGVNAVGDSKSSVARAVKSAAGEKKTAMTVKSEADSEKGAEDSEGTEKQKLEEKLRSTPGKVVSYDSGWNLVVVNLGDEDGVTMESSMQVRRGGQVVAKLRIAKVDAKQFTATVLPLEGKRKADVVRGDMVVLSANGPS
jgi:chromosome segregation ATPase